MTDWPNPDQPGYPQNPERDAFIFLRKGETIQDGDECPTDNCQEWLPVDRWSIGSKYNPLAFKIFRGRLTQADHAASVAAAAEAMREACARYHDETAAILEKEDVAAGGNVKGAAQLARKHRADADWIRDIPTTAPMTAAQAAWVPEVSRLIAASARLADKKNYALNGGEGLVRGEFFAALAPFTEAKP